MSSGMTAMYLYYYRMSRHKRCQREMILAPYKQDGVFQDNYVYEFDAGVYHIYEVLKVYDDEVLVVECPYEKYVDDANGLDWSVVGVFKVAPRKDNRRPFIKRRNCLSGKCTLDGPEECRFYSTIPKHLILQSY